MNALELAQMFHRYYEDMAHTFSYETREETRAFDPESPNGRLMVAVCEKVLDDLRKHVRSNKPL